MNPVIRYALAALLLLGSTLSNAAYLWDDNNHRGVHTHATAEEAGQHGSPISGREYCGLQYTSPTFAYIKTLYTPTQSCTSSGVQVTASDNGDPCPSGYQENQQGFCEPAPQCIAGSKNIFVRYSFTEMQGDTFDTDQALIQNGGCLYDSISVEECGVYPDGTKACLYEYTQTDQAASGTESQPDEYTDGQAPQQSHSDDGGSTTYTQDPTITNPDGSTTQTTNETTTNTAGSGTEVWNDSEHIYVRDSTGTTTIYDRQKTTTTNTDGSVDEHTTTTKTTETPATSTISVNKNNGNVTNSNNSTSTTYNQTTTTNNYYDSEGNLTGSDSTTEGGTEPEGNEDKPGNCGAPDQPDCQVKLQGEDALQDPAGKFDTEVIPQLDERITKIENITSDNDISADLLDINPFDLHAGATCDPTLYTTDYHNSIFRPLESFCSYYDSDMRPIIAFFFYMLTAWGMYQIWTSTMRRSA